MLIEELGLYQCLKRSEGFEKVSYPQPKGRRRSRAGSGYLSSTFKTFVYKGSKQPSQSYRLLVVSASLVTLEYKNQKTTVMLASVGLPGVRRASVKVLNSWNSCERSGSALGSRQVMMLE